MEYSHLKLVAPQSSAEGLEPLISIYEATKVRVSVITYHNEPPTTQELAQWGRGMDAVLYLSPPRRSPRTVVKAPFVFDQDGRRVPLGLYPWRNKEGIASFVDLLKATRTRPQEKLAVGLLAQRHPRYQRLVDRMATSLPTDACSYRWTSSDVVREDMIGLLKAGIGLGVYFGHGRPVGWVGYYGLRLGHFQEESGVPMGALLQLCCLTASRRRVGYAFAENMVTTGQAAATFGAVSPTRHADNMRWAVRISNVLKQEKPPGNLGDLLSQACPLQQRAWEAYRIIGDPLAPIQTSMKIVDQLNPTVN